MIPQAITNYIKLATAKIADTTTNKLLSRQCWQTIFKHRPKIINYVLAANWFCKRKKKYLFSRVRIHFKLLTYIMFTVFCLHLNQYKLWKIEISNYRLPDQEYISYRQNIKYITLCKIDVLWALQIYPRYMNERRKYGLCLIWKSPYCSLLGCINSFV